MKPRAYVHLALAIVITLQALTQLAAVVVPFYSATMCEPAVLARAQQIALWFAAQATMGVWVAYFLLRGNNDH
jgi:hypothetical protein